MKKVVRKQKDIKKSKINKRLNKYRETLGKPNTKDLTTKDLERIVRMDFLSSDSLEFYKNISILNELLFEKGSRLRLDKDNLVESCVKPKEDKYFTKNELKQICNKLINYQDKFILYALFKGIKGKACEDLLSIKIEDVSKDFTYIKIRDNLVFTDDILKEYLKGLVDEKAYIRETFKGERYIEEYNLDNPYLLKPLPSKVNGNGMEKMTSETLRTRLNKISDLLFVNYNEKVALIPMKLYYSGIMFDMFEKETTEGIKWNISKIKEYSKAKGYSIKPYEVYTKYYNKYHKDNS